MRANIVTRTITTTKVKADCFNKETREIETREYVLPRTYKDEETLMKVLSKQTANEVVKPVAIVETAVCETLYGLPEADFIKYAKVLPPRGTKVEG